MTIGKGLRVFPRHPILHGGQEHEHLLWSGQLPSGGQPRETELRRFGRGGFLENHQSSPRTRAQQPFEAGPLPPFVETARIGKKSNGWVGWKCRRGPVARGCEEFRPESHSFERKPRLQHAQSGEGWGSRPGFL